MQEKITQILEVLALLEKLKKVVDPSKILPTFVKVGEEEKLLSKVLYGLALAVPNPDDPIEPIEFWKLAVTTQRAAENLLNGRFQNVTVDPEENRASLLGAILDSKLPLQTKRKAIEALAK